ncbi:MAG TPA: MurR/RpiR family transcriptional regulator [Beijerinckiaceae bacterium]|nr:MurR/RpiR family transcriptional regulator [Beijerinckiaceae bacterium]
MSGSEPTSSPLIEEIRRVGEGLGPAAQRVAAFIIENATRVPDLSITDVARAANVSEPTVARLCQSLGYSGFRELRIVLARQQPDSMPIVQIEISARDRPNEIATKVIDRVLSSLMKLKSELDYAAISAASILLAEARRIEFYAHGESAFLAQDAQLRFARLGIPSIAYSDSHQHVMSASTLGPRDAVVCISRSGANAELVQTLAILGENAVPVVGIMPRDTALGAYCTQLVHIGADDEPNVYAPKAYRFSQMATIEALAIATAVMCGPSATMNLERTRAASLGKLLD